MRATPGKASGARADEADETDRKGRASAGKCRRLRGKIKALVMQRRGLVMRPCAAPGGGGQGNMY